MRYQIGTSRVAGFVFLPPLFYGSKHLWYDVLMKMRRLEIANQANERLVCMEVLPYEPSNERFPVVIFCHGFGYFKEEDGLFTEEAKRLADKGYACFYFDFSGCGESEGNYEQTTLTKLTQDLRSVHGYVTSLDYIDASDVSLIGHSFGTSVINATQITDVKRIVLGGAPFYPFELIKDLFTDFNENGISRRLATSERTRTMGPQFWEDLKHYKPEELIRKFTCPILFIHGKQDTIVPIKNMEELSSFALKPWRLILESSNHDFKPEREKAFQAVVELFPSQKNHTSA
ncbi:MAG: putative hydrolase [Candidatus Saccharibacteria bacterium]|nr:putative hydrolase [Candidatus Saccharibacteria bacterium]